MENVSPQTNYFADVRSTPPTPNEVDASSSAIQGEPQGIDTEVDLAQSTPVAPKGTNSSEELTSSPTNYFEDNTTDSKIAKAIGISPAGVLTKELSKSLIPDIQESMRKQESSLLYGVAPSEQLVLDNTPVLPEPTKKASLYDYKTDIKEAYVPLKDGTLVPRFSSFTPDLDNAEYAAKSQSTFDKWMNGTGKLLGKTGINALGGTVGMVYGAAQAIAENRFSALYDNDLATMLDDWNTQLDYALPNYKTRHEEQMGFLRSMGTANFWADDVFGSLSFMAGAVISEGAWAALTGGASLASSGARLAARTANVGREVASIGGLAAGTKQTADLLRKSSQILTAGKAAGAVNSARFLVTSAFYESGMEARHAMTEATDDYINYMQTQEGRLPTNDELSSFLDQAVDKSNWVFGANVAIVGSANLLQLGQYFGIKPNFSNKLTNAFNKKVLGYGVEKTAVDGTSKFVANTGNKLQRGLRTAINISKRPVTEGVYEEGLQSVISNTYKDWLSYKYDKSLMGENLGITDAAISGLKEAYGTKEGLKEIGIGALVGLLGGVPARGKDGSRIYSGITEARSEDNYNEALASQLNSTVEKIPASVSRVVTRMGRLSQAQALLGKQQSAEKSGNSLEAATYSDLLEFTNILMQNESSDFINLQNEFSTAIDNTDVRAISDEFKNLTDQEVLDLKDNLKQAYGRDIKDYTKAIEVAKTLTPTDVESVSGDGTYSDFTTALAMNIYGAKKASERVVDYAQTISDVLNTPDYVNALTTFSSVGQEKIKAAREYKNALAEVERLKELQVNLTQNLTQTLESESIGTVAPLVSNGEVDKDAAKERVTASNNLRSAIAKNTIKLTEAQNRLSLLEKNFGNIKTNEEILRSRFIDAPTTEASISELANALNSVETIEETINTLRMNPNISDNTLKSIESLMREYSSGVVAMNSFLNTSMRMSDPKFTTPESRKGIFGKYLDRVARYEKENEVSFDKALVERVNSLDLTDSQKFTMLTLMQAGVDNVATQSIKSQVSEELGDYTEPITDTSTVESIDDTVWDAYKAGEVSDETMYNIAMKDHTNQTLTPREKTIKRNNRNQYRRQLRKVRASEGTANQTMTNNSNKPDTTVEGMKEKIESILHSSEVLKDDNVDIEDKSIIPTDDEVSEFVSLDKKYRQGKLTSDTPTDSQKEQIARLTTLRDKINLYGKLEGTEYLNGVTLADAITNIQQLNEGLKVKNTAEESEESIAEMLEQIFSSGTTTNVDTKNYTLVYDRATVSVQNNKQVSGSVTLKEGTTIQGINLKGIVDRMSNVAYLESIDNTTGEPTTILDVDTFTPNTNTIVNIVFNSGEKVTAYYDTRMNVSFDSRQLPLIEENSEFVFKTLGDTSSQYKLLLDKSFRAVKTNFTEDGFEFNIPAIYKLNEGDKLPVSINLNNDYNKSIIQKYNSSRKTVEDKKELSNNLVLEVLDYNKNLVSLLKAIHSDDLQGDTLTRLSTLRETALDTILDLHVDTEGNILTDGAISLDNAITVKSVLPGRPNLNIENGVLKYTPIDMYTASEVYDIGYIESGKLHLRNKTESVETYPFTTHILRDKSGVYGGQKIPVVVVKIAGKYYTYPAKYESQTVDLVPVLERIANDTSLSIPDRLYALNDTVIKAGLSTEVYGFTYGDMVEDKFNAKLDTFKNLTLSEDVSNVLDQTKLSYGDALGKYSVNINLLNEPFNSPKLIVDYNTPTRNTEVDSGVIEDIENLDDSTIFDIEDRNNKKC